MSDNRGVFISFEGGEGVGKSTHISFLAFCLEDAGFDVLRVREPGGTKIGEEIRSIILDPENSELDRKTELLLYEAARCQIMKEKIIPALDAGKVVLCDRFIDSTIAYQGVGRGLNRQVIECLNKFSTREYLPDRTILIFSKSTSKSLQRATNDDGLDRLELAGVDFHRAVNREFMNLAKSNPGRFRTVELQDKKSETSKKIFEALCDIFHFIDNDFIESKKFEILHSSIAKQAKDDDDEHFSKVSK
ncbi:MAG: dTMP kinase [Eggerthellaceae bacterium]|nr:dTMP kinase [Eggerthellaceae bacterium]